MNVITMKIGRAIDESMRMYTNIRTSSLLYQVRVWHETNSAHPAHLIAHMELVDFFRWT